MLDLEKLQSRKFDVLIEHAALTVAIRRPRHILHLLHVSTHEQHVQVQLLIGGIGRVLGISEVHLLLLQIVFVGTLAVWVVLVLMAVLLKLHRATILLPFRRE
jgi:hypothetical protein